MTTQNPTCWRFALCFAKFQEPLNVLSYEARGEAVAGVVALGMILVMVRVV